MHDYYLEFREKRRKTKTDIKVVIFGKYIKIYIYYPPCPLPCWWCSMLVMQHFLKAHHYCAQNVFQPTAPDCASLDEGAFFSLTRWCQQKLFRKESVCISFSQMGLIRCIDWNITKLWLSGYTTRNNNQVHVWVFSDSWT